MSVGEPRRPSSGCNVMGFRDKKRAFIIHGNLLYFVLVEECTRMASGIVCGGSVAERGSSIRGIQIPRLSVVEEV